MLGCLCKNRHFLEQKKTPSWRGKFVTYSLNLETKTTARLMQPVFFFLERLLYGGALIFLGNGIFFQVGACISLFSLVSLLYAQITVYLGVTKPFK